jgi:hypothetical protein
MSAFVGQMVNYQTGDAVAGDYLKSPVACLLLHTPILEG